MSWFLMHYFASAVAMQAIYNIGFEHKCTNLQLLIYVSIDTFWDMNNVKSWKNHIHINF